MYQKHIEPTHGEKLKPLDRRTSAGIIVIIKHLGKRLEGLEILNGKH